MLRRHLPDIVYIALLLAIAIPYGLFWLGFVNRHSPLWVSIPALVAVGAVIAAVTEPLSRAVLRRLESRTHQKAITVQVKDAPRCASCRFPILGTSVAAPVTPDGPVQHWHMDADHPTCRDAFTTARTRGAAA